MPRKPKKLEDVTHGPFKAAIRFDVEEGEFSCEYGGSAVASPELAVVRKGAYDRLRAMAVRERSQVVPAVQAAREHRGCCLIEFHVEQEDTVYPMVPAGADLRQMIRRPDPRVPAAAGK